MSNGSKKRRGNHMAGALLAGALTFAGGSALAQSADPIDQATRGMPPSGQPTGPISIPAPPPQSGSVAGVAPAGGQRDPLVELAKEAGNSPRPAPATDASGPVNGEAGSAPSASPMAPTQPMAGGAGGSASAGGPAGNGEEVDNSGTINANYDATLEIYQSIIDKQGTDSTNIDRRIQSNEEMIAKYKPLLAQAEAEQRHLQVDFMNRAFALKQQKEAGQITDDLFGKQIASEEQKFNRRRDQLAQDVSFYRDEITQADARLKDLREQRKLVLDKAEREGMSKPAKKAPGEALFQGLTGTLDKLSAFHVRYTMDGVGRTQDFGRNGPAVGKK